MNPNKNIVNTKNNSPWLLCPSKSFPGKFYYFNGLTGETAWSLNEADNKNLKRDTIRRVTDKTHTYPEPLCPPADESTNTTSSSFIKKSNFVNSSDFCGRTNFSNRTTFGTIPDLSNRNFYSGTDSSNWNKISNEPKLSHGYLSHGANLGHGTSYNRDLSKQFQRFPSPSPTFGQTIFPRYITNEPVTTKVIWTLTPMFIPEPPTNHQMLDQVTQYEPQETFTQSAAINRFQDSKAQGNPFSSAPLIKQFPPEPTFDQKFKTVSSNWTQMFDPKPQTKEESCQTSVTKTKGIQTLDSDVNPYASRPVENLVSTFENATLNEENNVKNGIEETESKLCSLDKNDLRLLLVAKRRKSVGDTRLDIGDALKKDATKQPKAQLNENQTPKKQVTFALSDQDSTSESIQSNGSQSNDSTRFEDVSRPSKQTQEWYIAVDTSVLLTEFEFIEEFVRSDKNCRLLIPHLVKSEVETKSRGDSAGRQGISAARQILRRLATPASHIVVQNKPEDVRGDEDSILECCWRLLQDNYYVILITNSTKLSNKAQTIDLECYTIDEIKKTVNPIASKQDIDLPNVKIVVVNDKKPTGNLFQQSISELNPFRLSQNVEIPVHSIRKKIFDNLNTEDENVFRNKDKNTDKLINLTDTHEALKNVSHSDIDKINKDIKRLDITNHLPTDQTFKPSKIVNDQAVGLNAKIINDIKNNRNDKVTIKISGITKLDSVFDLDEELTRYYVKSVEMENRVNFRIDEWVCRLTQIMEGTLTDILLKEKVKPKKMLPPWNLYEAIQLTGEKFKNERKLKTIMERFSLHLLNCSSNTGKLNKNIKSTDLMKLVGYSMILIQNLKEILSYVELNEADDLLSELIKQIEDPATDVNLALDNIITPILNRGDMEFEIITPLSYKRKQADVLEYLKKHFTAMESYEIEKDEPKIVRTLGKDLKTLKINMTKSISIDKTEKLPTDEVSNVVVEPKVIRNVKVIDAYEEKLKRQAEFDLERLDYEETYSTISFQNDEEILDKYDEIEHEDNLNDDTDKINNLTETSELLDSSDVNNECVFAYPLMKTFMNELKRTLMFVYHFINESIQDYREGDTSEDRKTDIDLKINMAHEYLTKIIDRLKSIIARESSNGPTLKDLLIRAGDYVEEDEKMSGYKQVVTKYLEQAQILEDALNLMVTISHEKSVSISTDEVAYHGTFATAVAGQSETSNGSVILQMTNRNAV